MQLKYICQLGILVSFTTNFACCVSAKKFRILEGAFDSSQAKITQMNADVTALKKENEKLASELGRSKTIIDELSMKNPIRSTDLVPTLSCCPPPQPSDYFYFQNLDTKKFINYAQIDTLISVAFSKAKLSHKFYLAMENGGFAIASTIDEINEDGEKVREEISEVNSWSTFVLHFFSWQHFNELLFSKDGHYRCIIIAVSPNLSTLGGKKMKYDDLQNWVYAKSIKLPPNIGNSPLKKETQVVALLYEFEQNENLEYKTQVLDDKHCKTKLEKTFLIKYLNNGN
jgi:hypothetical protein